MAEQLFPTFPEITVHDADDTLVQTYSPSFLFDFGTGEFALDGANHVRVCNGYEAWKNWCVKAVMTERDAWMAYSTNIGVEVENALKQPSTPAAKLALERTITEALLVHPSTQSVGDFSYTLNGDALRVSFTVKGKDVAAFTATLDVAMP